MAKKKKKKPLSPKVLARQMTMASRRKILRVGRNQPCPCGSGRKYKDCHQSEGEPFLLKIVEKQERAKSKQLRQRLKAEGVPWYRRWFADR